MERRLAAILAADVVGYSRLMGDDEAGTLAALNAHREELIEPKAAQYHGRTVKLMGDGALMEFGSVVDAVSFAVRGRSCLRSSVGEAGSSLFPPWSMPDQRRRQRSLRPENTPPRNHRRSKASLPRSSALTNPPILPRSGLVLCPEGDSDAIALCHGRASGIRLR